MRRMPSLAFDTHAAVKQLQDAGADERLAEAVVATRSARRSASTSPPRPTSPRSPASLRPPRPTSRRVSKGLNCG